jgi:hypothetical protein
MTREEENEAEEMKMLQVKASVLNRKILEPPKLGIRVERKPPTIPVPFKLTEFIRKKSEAPPVFTFTAKPVPTAVLDAPRGILKKDLPLTVPVLPACSKKSKLYAMSLEVKDGKKCLIQKEIYGLYSCINVFRCVQLCHTAVPTATNVTLPYTVFLSHPGTPQNTATV